MVFSNKNDLLLLNQKNIELVGKYQKRNELDIHWNFENDEYYNEILLENLDSNNSNNSKYTIIKAFGCNLPNGIDVNYNENSIILSGKINFINYNYINPLYFRDREQLLYDCKNFYKNGRIFGKSFIFTPRIFAVIKCEEKINTSGNSDSPDNSRNSNNKLQKNTKNFKILCNSKKINKLNDFDRKDKSYYYKDEIIQIKNCPQWEHSLLEDEYFFNSISVGNYNDYVFTQNPLNFDFDFLKFTNANYVSSLNIENSEKISTKYINCITPFIDDIEDTLENHTNLCMNMNEPYGIILMRDTNINKIDYQSILNENCGIIECIGSSNSNSDDTSKIHYYIISKRFLFPVVIDYDIDNAIWNYDYYNKKSEFTEDEWNLWFSFRDSYKLRYS